MANLLRQRALAKVFGNGLSGAAAATAAGWLFDQAREAMRKDPQRLDVSQLRPGETYLVTTRPAMNRAERRLDDRVKKLQGRVGRDARPPRAARRTARKLAAVRRRVDRASDASRRQVRLETRRALLEAALEQRVALTPRQRRRVDRLAAAQADLELVRGRTVGKARKHARPPRARRFL